MQMMPLPAAAARQVCFPALTKATPVAAASPNNTLQFNSSFYSFQQDEAAASPLHQEWSRALLAPAVDIPFPVHLISFILAVCAFALLQQSLSSSKSTLQLVRRKISSSRRRKMRSAHFLPEAAAATGHTKRMAAVNAEFSMHYAALKD